MEVKISEQIWQLTNDEQGVEKLFRQMDEFLQTKAYYLNHLVVDGIEVYEDMEAYILERVAEVKVVHIEVSTFQQSVDQMLISADMYLTRAMPEVVKLIAIFYQGSRDSAWEKFDQLLEALDWILRTVSSIQDGRILYSNKEEYRLREQQLRGKVQLLLDAVESVDMTLIGDLLNYEIQPELQLLQNEIRKTLDSEVMHNDLSR
jgi:hypothetical protein